MALQERMHRDLFYDAAIYYAFGVEKLCKAIVHDVNPLFLLETHSFENAVCAIYGHRLVERARKKVDKDVNRSLIPFQASMLRAAKFSQAVEDNIGRFTELANIRGALAHRSWTEVDMERSCEFLLRTFAPTVELFAREIEFGVEECFETEERHKWLIRISNRFLAEENYGEFVKDILARHLAIWESRKDDAAALQKAASDTEACLKKIKKSGPYPKSGVCPCCKQPAILLYQFIDRYSRDEVATVGSYAVGLACCHCDIYLSGYRAVDHFKLNDQVGDPFRKTFKVKVSDLIGD